MRFGIASSFFRFDTVLPKCSIYENRYRCDTEGDCIQPWEILVHREQGHQEYAETTVVEIAYMVYALNLIN